MQQTVFGKDIWMAGVRVLVGTRKGAFILTSDEKRADWHAAYTAAGMPVTTVHAPIRDVIAGRYKVSDFDLIYSAGLYDYLEPAVAERLTTLLWRGLNPGGQIVLTNFLEGTKDRGWMEALMDWWLI